jgi:hypothetical protein
LIEKLDRELREQQNPLGIDWLALRREMLDNVYQEVAEGYYEAGRYHAAIRYSLPPHRRLTGDAIRFAARALARRALAAFA